MSHRVFNFSAGPATLPEPVLRQAQAELLDWQGLGASVAEISRQSADALAISMQAVKQANETSAIVSGLAIAAQKIGDVVKLISEIAASYGEAAGLAKRAGFEMLMIHGGHGWLINQFLSPYFNKRTDKYGGSLENRCRLAVEVLKAVREAVGPGFPIEFRMSGSELFEGG